MNRNVVCCTHNVIFSICSVEKLYVAGATIIKNLAKCNVI